MRRIALKDFIRGLVIAALPLSAAGYGQRNGDAGDGGAQVECHTSPCAFGLRSDGLDEPAPIAGAPLGAFFARGAQLEAASAHAFERRAGELAAHRAPSHLVEAARRAARDEMHHAHMMTRLAQRFGATPPPVEPLPRAVRPLVAIAIENAVEGCVGETWRAVTATWQSRTAADPAVRSAMAVIAVDETRHAELAAEIDEWLAPRLTPAERAQVAAARRAMAHTILDEVRADVVAPELVTTAGLLAPHAAHALADGVAERLWR